MDLKLLSLVPIFIVAAAPAVAQVADTGRGDERPEWLQEHMQREASRLKARKVRFDEMRSRLPGDISIAPAYANNTWHVGTDIGGDYPVVCFVHESEMNLANTVAAQAAFDVDAVSRDMGEAVSARQSHRVDAGAVDGSPYLGLEYQYSIGSGDDEHIGLIKVWAANRDGATLVCKHNEIGFRNSVFTLFDGFVRNFANRNAPPRPYYGEARVATADGELVGVTSIRFTRDDDDYVKIEADRSTLQTGADDAVVATDRYDLMWSEPGGELINAYSTSTTDGGTDSRLTLAYADDAWQLSGTLAGENVAETLQADIRPLTPLGWYRLVRTAMNSDSADPVSFRTWAPGAAPATLVDATFARDGDGRGVLDVGPVSTRIEVDDDGYPRVATETRGDTEVVHTRVWRDGKLE